MFNYTWYSELALSTPGIFKYVAASIVKMGCDWIVVWMFNYLVRLHAEDTRERVMEALVWWFATTILNKIVVAYLYDDIKTSFNRELLMTFRQQTFSNYEMLNFPTRKIESLDSYLVKFRSAQVYLRVLSFAGIGCVFGVARAGFDTFITLRHVAWLQAALGVVFCVTLTLLVRKSFDMRAQQDLKHERQDVIRNRIKFEEPYFEMGHRGCGELIRLHRAYGAEDAVTKQGDREYASLLAVGEEVAFLLVIYWLYSTDGMGGVADIINVLRAVGSLCRTAEDVANFYTSSAQGAMQFRAFNEFWVRNEANLIQPVTDAQRVPMPKQLTFLYIEFAHSSPAYHMSLRAPFQLPQGAKVLLRGETGAGKSTLCELIQGRDIVSELEGPALKFEEGNQRYFAHHMIECGQEMSAVVRWDSGTIRDHFIGEPDDECLFSFCRAVCIEDKVRALGVDEQINKRLSGGERQRVTLAANLHFTHSMGARLVLLDEPERGLGARAATVIKNIVLHDLYKNITVFVSSHSSDLDESIFTHIIDISKEEDRAVVSCRTPQKKTPVRKSLRTSKNSEVRLQIDS